MQRGLQQPRATLITAVVRLRWGGEGYSQTFALDYIPDPWCYALVHDGLSQRKRSTGSDLPQHPFLVEACGNDVPSSPCGPSLDVALGDLSRGRVPQNDPVLSK